MATPFDAKAAGLPVVGPYAGETLENMRLRRDALRNVDLGPGPQDCVGIKNRKYDCYLISIFQALLHHPRVAQFVRHHHVGPRLRRDGKDNLARHETEHGCGFCQLYDMFVLYWTKDLVYNERRKGVQKRFEMIRQRFNQYLIDMGREPFHQNEQHDASEAYLEFVLWLVASGDWETGAISAEAGKALFTMETRGTSTCLNCTKQTIQEYVDMMVTMDLRFSGEEVSTWPLVTLIQSSLSDRVEKKCPDCSPDKDVDFVRTAKVTHFPELLCLRLVLYSYTEKGPTLLKHVVDVPEMLNMNEYSEIPTTARTINYELYGVVRHNGNGKSLNAGHYVAHIKADDGTWTLCNDHKLFESSLLDATSFSAKSIPYLLFYARKYGEDERANIKQEDAEYVLPAWMANIPADEETGPGEDPAGTKEPTSPPGQTEPRTTPKSREGTPDGTQVPGEEEPKNPEGEPTTPVHKPKKGTPGKPGKKPEDTPYVPDVEENSDDDDEVPPPKPSPKPRSPSVPATLKDYKKLKVAELKQELTRRGISFTSKLKKANLQALLRKDDKAKEAAKGKTVPKDKVTKGGPTKLKIIVTYSHMKVVELKAELTKRGISFKSKLRKAELIALLEADDKAKKARSSSKEATPKSQEQGEPTQTPTQPTEEPAGKKRPAEDTPEEEPAGKKRRSEDPPTEEPASKKRPAEDPPTEEPTLRRSKRIRR